MTDYGVKDLVAEVYEHFDGKAPSRGADIDLHLIVLAVVEILRDRGFILLEQQVDGVGSSR